MILAYLILDIGLFIIFLYHICHLVGTAPEWVLLLVDINFLDLIAYVYWCLWLLA